MADQTSGFGNGLSRNNRDMGDGSYAEVVAAVVGASQATVRGVTGAPFTSTDQHSAAGSVTDAPTSTKKIVVDEIMFSVDTTMNVTFKCETTAAVVFGPFYILANNTHRFAPIGPGRKLATADKKLQVITSASGNIMVDVAYHSEA